MSYVPSRREIEIRRRIRLSVAALVYERLNDSVMSDAEFDRESLLVDLSIDTGNKRLDRFFRSNFTPYTGLWVHRHPEKIKLMTLWNTYYNKEARHGTANRSL